MHFEKSEHKGRRFFAAILGVLGTLMLAAVLLAVSPLTLPRLFGCGVYEVLTGSMAPAIPEGSAVLVKSCAPESVETGDVIMFDRSGDVITHRVLENRRDEAVFITRGDANPAADFEPVAYGSLIGRVQYHVAAAGRVLAVISGTAGRIRLIALACAAVLLKVLAARLRGPEPERKRKRTGETDSPGGRRRWAKVRRVLIVLMLTAFLGSFAGTLYIRRQYKNGEDLYEDAAQSFTAQAAPVSAAVTAPAAEAAEAEGECPPITVDFDALRAINPDIVGWIYCPQTRINYPVLHGENNDKYISTGYDGKWIPSGSIFMDAANAPDFSDPNTIIYGHHMGDGSMFTALDLWQDQKHFDRHPVMWLLTPERDYKVVLFSAYYVSAYADVYSIFREYDTPFKYFLHSAVRDSAVTGPELPEGEARYVMLSTCAYVFTDARAVVHGVLEPLDSAGGIPLPG